MTRKMKGAAQAGKAAKHLRGVHKISRASAVRAKREAAMLAGPVLSPEAEEAAEKICARIDEKVRAAVRQLMQRAPEVLFGPGEFELRDELHRVSDR